MADFHLYCNVRYSTRPIGDGGFDSLLAFYGANGALQS